MSKVRKNQSRKSNPNLIRLIDELLLARVENDAAIWKDLAERLSKPSKNHAEVNLSRIQKYGGDNEVILVPGKVLGNGDISKPFEVAALSFSDNARTKIESSGGKCLTIKELVVKNPKGTGVRILA